MLILVTLGIVVCQADSGPYALALERQSAEAYRKGRWDQAARAQERAVAAWRMVVPRVDLGAPLYNLAQIYLAQGRWRDAETQAQLAAKSPVARVRSEVLLAKIAFQRRDYARAEQRLRSVIGALQGPELASATNDLGMVRAARGDLAGARHLIESLLPNESGRILANLALICFRLRDTEAARRYYRQAIDLLDAKGDKSDLGIVLTEYSEVLAKMGNKAESRAAASRARSILAASESLQSIHVQALAR